MQNFAQSKLTSLAAFNNLDHFKDKRQDRI